MNKYEILSYVKTNISSFEKGGVSSNEIRFFEFKGKKYILKSSQQGLKVFTRV